MFLAVHEVDEVRLEVRDFLRRAHMVQVLRRILELVEHITQDDSGFSRRALVLLHDGPRLFLHAVTVRRVVKELRDGLGKLLAVLDRDAGIAVLEQRIRILEIEHVVADDDGLAMCGRLEDVVAAMRHEAAADIDDVADAVDLAALANRVEDADVRLIALRARLFLEARARRRVKTRLLAEMHDLCRAQQLARRDDEAGVRMILPHGLERRGTGGGWAPGARPRGEVA